MLEVFRFLSRWSNLIAILISAAALALSAASYLHQSSVAAEKVRFHMGVADKVLSHTVATCRSATGEGGFMLCQNFLKQSESQIEDLKTVIGEEATQLSADDYKDAMLALGSAKASLATAQESLTFNKKKSWK